MTVLKPLGRRAADLALSVGAIVGGLCLVAAALMLLFDARLLIFRSGSMSPTIETGALALAREVPAPNLQIGDVVSVRTDSGARVTHRIVAMDRIGGETDLELRGDSNRTSDPQRYLVADADRVVASVPWLGFAAAWIASPVGLFLLGLYAALLLGVLFGRRGGGERLDGPTRGDTLPEEPARPGRARGAATVGFLVFTVLAAGTVGVRVDPTLAAWTDPVQTTGTSFDADTVPVPGNFRCGALGIFSVTFNWDAVPGATNYTLHYGSGGSETVTVNGTSKTITAVISGGTAWVNANRVYPSSTWTSGNSNTRGYSVLFVSLCG